MKKIYDKSPYKLTINDGIVQLYDGRELVETANVKSNEIEVDTCERVINKHIKHGSYHNWLNIVKIIENSIEKGKFNAKDESLWIDYLKSDYVRLLRELLSDIREDIGRFSKWT